MSVLLDAALMAIMAWVVYLVFFGSFIRKMDDDVSASYRPAYKDGKFVGMVVGPKPSDGPGTAINLLPEPETKPETKPETAEEDESTYDKEAKEYSK